MALTIGELLRAVNPNIGLVQNPDGSYRIGIEDVNSDEIRAAVEAVNVALQAGGVSQAQFAAMVTALQLIDNAVNGTQFNVGIIPTKTILAEPMPITAVLAGAQGISTVLNVAALRKVTVFIDHAKDAAGAAVGQGTEYVIQGSEKAAGNDAWRPLAAFTVAITAPTAMVTDNNEAIGATVIECGAAVPVVGDIVFFKNATIALSEWANVIARDVTGGAEFITIESGLTNAQAAGTYYTQGEHRVISFDVEAITRIRVVANNTKGTTNQNIVWRCAAITMA